ncbi:MAG: NTP transferase domain-containing protein [Coprobacillus sp.]|nr:NTP transferase domain-containing protein [Coprobacillus sp.]
MKNEWLKQYIGNETMSAVEAMQKIDINAKGILFILDKKGRLVGSLTDGDIRRWLIKTGDLDGIVAQMMLKNPSYLFENEASKCIAFMRKKKITAIPILDTERRIVEIVFDTRIDDKSIKFSNLLEDIPVIVMAGGKGTRLYPYTKILPKPLIPIGDIPILERIFNRFNRYGVNEFYLTVNYKKEMIRSYFNDLNLPYKIHYVEEEKPLGTAGSIKLIKKEFHTPVIVTNCDILIEADYGKVLCFHKESKNAMTIVSSLKNTIIPYGVLHSKGEGVIVSIEEKPKLSHFINTGMYIINPEYITRIPDHTFYHMIH